MRVSRDQYEDTAFDLTRHVDAGPFGDTMRFPPLSKIADPVNGISRGNDFISMSILVHIHINA